MYSYDLTKEIDSFSDYLKSKNGKAIYKAVDYDLSHVIRLFRLNTVSSKTKQTPIKTVLLSKAAKIPPVLVGYTASTVWYVRHNVLERPILVMKSNINNKWWAMDYKGKEFTITTEAATRKECVKMVKEVLNRR